MPSEASPSRLLLFLLCLVSECLAQDSGDGFDQNPVLQHQPKFTRSLPVQVLLLGIKFTLTGVLLFHLIFTAQYHWPLARTNYALQMAGVITLFISLVASIHVIFARTMQDSQQWPYMLTYLALDIPPSNGSFGFSPDDAEPWNMGMRASWYTLDALTSAFVQLTHIQFLTLLYPSRLEGRLILVLLGPLAVVSASMEFLPLQDEQRVLDIADTVRNTCNAALSLLFTAALMLWGFVVNRERAWRTDGGTAAFGAAAITLALISSALNFLYIPSKDEYHWLPKLIWAVMQWQNFLGWWWWVGGEMGVSEVEELIRREERRARKRRARAANRSDRKEKAQALWRNASETLRFKSTHKPKAEPLENIEMADRTATTGDTRPPPSVKSHESLRTATSATGFIARHLQNTAVGRVLGRWYGILRRAHLRAVHVQAIEHVERRQQVYRSDGVEAADGVVGWGLGSFGLRERERQGVIDAENEDRGELLRTDDANPSPQHVAQPSQSNSSTGQPWSWLWWGPLRRWRLQDSTSY